MTKEEITRIKITADEGKVFRRIFDGQIFGKEVYLGYTHYVGGKKLDPPVYRFSINKGRGIGGTQIIDNWMRP